MILWCFTRLEALDQVADAGFIFHTCDEGGRENRCGSPEFDDLLSTLRGHFSMAAIISPIISW